MYLSILLLPLLGAISSGLFGRKLGVTGGQLITCICMIAAAILSIIAFYEVALLGSPVSIHLSSWIDSGMLSVDWAFMFDSLTVSMLLPVLVVSSMVHVYSVSYMSEDPHNQRFFAYLSMFTFFMLILVAGNNYLILFLGWEGIGVSSYLLINFWFTRIQANKSAIKAMVVNRVGDMFLSIAFFGLFWAFGNLDYATIYSLSPYMNETVLTIIGLLFLLAAMGKSAQLGLHSWLPDAMEGLVIFIFFILAMLLWVNIVQLDSNSIIYYSSLPLIVTSIPRHTLEAMTGNMLGDGYIGYPNLNRDGKASGNARYAMTMAIKFHSYMLWLFNNIYSIFSISGLKPYPNVNLPQHKGKEVTQYTFNTKGLPLFSALHSLWYIWNSDLQKFVKIVPLCIAEMFSPVSLAYWIMDDGYFETYGRAQTVLLCTENFTLAECILLQSVLLKLGIKSTLIIRNKVKDTYRIRISKTSMPLLIELVKPHMHASMLYKLGL